MTEPVKKRCQNPECGQWIYLEKRKGKKAFEKRKACSKKCAKKIVYSEKEKAEKQPWQKMQRAIKQAQHPLTIIEIQERTGLDKNTVYFTISRSEHSAKFVKTKGPSKRKTGARIVTKIDINRDEVKKDTPDPLLMNFYKNTQQRAPNYR